MKKTTLFLSMIFIIAFGAKAQTTYLLQEDFSSITSGNNTSSTGANSAWTGNTNFPTVVSAYQAGGVVKIGTGSVVGSITSKALDLSVNGGSFSISFDVKGWTTVEGSITVTVTGLTAQTVTYTSTMSSTSFENKILTFTGGTANSTITIATTAKRAYIDNVNVYYAITCNPANLAFATNSISKIIGAASFTQTATSLNSGAISYSSSATNVATVNPTTAEVTPVAIGTTTITATQASANGYCASTATYTLNVTAAPTLTVTDITDPSMTSNVGSSVSQIINVSAVNLTTDLGLAITGANADLFSLSKYTVTQTGGNVQNTAITITYSPILAGTHTATLTMASTGAMDVSRNLNGNADLTSINSVVTNLNVYVENKNIKFDAQAGETLDIFNATGQRVIHSVTTEGLNSVSCPALNGVILVKVGNRIGKLII